MSQGSLCNTRMPSVRNKAADSCFLGPSFWEGGRYYVYKPRHRKLSEHSMPWEGEGTEGMDEERDLLGQMFLVCRDDGVMVWSFGNEMLSLLSFLNKSFHETLWFELFTWIFTVDTFTARITSEFPHVQLKHFVTLYMICWSFLPQRPHKHLHS